MVLRMVCADVAVEKRAEWLMGVNVVADAGLVNGLADRVCRYSSGEENSVVDGIAVYWSRTYIFQAGRS